MNTQIISTPIKDIKIHTLISPEETFEVTTQIIETPHKLIVVDAQFFLSYAYEVAEYVKKLNMPVECVIITHAHPDHWLGLEAFEQYPIVSIPEVAAEIENGGDHIVTQVGQFHGNLTTRKKIVPQPLLKAGSTQMAGIQLEIEHISDAEGTHHVLIKLPEYKSLLAQDLAYNKIHLFIGNNTHDNWYNTTNRLQKLDEYDYVFCGHGKPGNKDIFTEMSHYIAFVKNLLQQGADPGEVKQKLLQQYPDYKCPQLIDISMDYIFHGEHKLTDE